MARILVVDDDAQIRDLLDKGFSHRGHEVVTVPELAQAVAKVSEQDYDLVILDLQMRGEEGTSFLRQLRDARSDMPIVIYSGMISGEMEHDLRKAGANEVVAKGGDLSELFAQTDKILKAGKRLFADPDRERTLLIIDDDEAIRGMLNKFFTQRKYRILEASDGEQGLKIASSQKVDCTLLDIHLPGESGLEVLPKLLAIDPKIGVVMVSGAKDRELVQKAVELGAYGYIMKPFDFVYLELTVASKLAIAGSG